MKISITGYVAIAALLILSLASGGCESTPLLAPTGADMNLLASPVSAVANAGLDPTEETYFSVIYGQLLSTTVGGAAELISDGEDGLLVPVDDVAALQRSIAKLAAEPELRAALGARAARTAEDHTWNRVGPRLRELLTGS